MSDEEGGQQTVPVGSVEAAVAQLQETAALARNLAGAPSTGLGSGETLRVVVQSLDAAIESLGGFLEDRRQEVERTARRLSGELDGPVPGARSPVERFLGHALRVAMVGLFSWDVGTERAWYSEEWKRLLGWAGPEVGSGLEEWHGRIHPADLPGSRDALRELAEGRREVSERRFRMRHRDGGWRWIHSRSTAVLDPTGRCRRIVGSHVDVTELMEARAAEAAARQDREALDAILRREHEMTPLACVLMAPDTTVLEWNPAAERIFGWKADEAIGRKGTELQVPPEGADSLARRVARVLGGVSPGPVVEGCVRRDGGRVLCEWHDSAILDASGAPVAFLGMGRDVTAEEQARTALSASEERLRLLLDRLPVAMAVSRRDGSVERMNASSAALFGWTLEELPTIRDWVRRTIPEPAARRAAVAAAMAHWRAAVEGGAREPAVLEVTTRDGARRSIAFACVVIDDLDVWTFTDLTGILRLEAESARLGRIVESALEEVYVVDAASLRILNANRGARDNLGYTAEEILGLRMGDISPDLAVEELERRLAPLRDGVTAFVRYEAMHRRKTGTFYPVEGNVQLVMDGGAPLFVSIASDVSERRLAEERLRGLALELEERVRARTASLEEANLELESFAYSVAHDLRAPLRAMDGFGQILLEEQSDRLDDEGRRLLGRVREGARRMGHLVDDLLRLSRVSRAEMTWEDVDLSAVAKEIGAELAEAEPGRRVVLTVAPGIGVRGDHALIRILVENLLRNAWKFTARLAEAHVEVGRAAAGPHGAIVFRDDGVGFDPAHAGQLFRPFHRLHRPDEFEGTGIGLAVVDRIARRHGGWVAAEGSPGRGATFTLCLPGWESAP